MATVLVVDDDESLRQLMARVLEDEGHRVLLAGDGLEALGLVERQSPRVHLVVTDVLMPVMTGPELASSLAEHTAQVPVLFVSGGHGRTDVTGPVLWKPFRPADLTDMVRLLLIRSPEPAPILEGCR